MASTATHEFWAAKIKAHALEHYNDKGIRWDYVVECWDLKDIIEHLNEFPPRSYTDALDWFRSYAETMDEREKATHF